MPEPSPARPSNSPRVLRGSRFLRLARPRLALRVERSPGGRRWLGWGHSRFVSRVLETHLARVLGTRIEKDEAVRIDEKVRAEALVSIVASEAIVPFVAEEALGSFGVEEAIVSLAGLRAKAMVSFATKETITLPVTEETTASLVAVGAIGNRRSCCWHSRMRLRRP